MAPVIDGLPRPIMRPIDDPPVLTYDLALCDHQEAVGIDAQADGAVGEGCRHAVAVALQVDEAGRGDPLAILNEAVERPSHRHQARHLIGPGIGDRAKLNTMWDIL